MVNRFNFFLWFDIFIPLQPECFAHIKKSATAKPLIAPFTAVHGTQTDLLDRMGNVLFFLLAPAL